MASTWPHCSHAPTSLPWPHRRWPRKGPGVRRIKEALTITRRDIRKLIAAALEEGADGDWEKVEAIYGDLADRLQTDDLATVLEEMRMLREEVLNMLDNTEKTSANDARFEHHKQNSNTQSLNELEPRSRKEPGAKIELKSFPLSMVLKACPEISMYGRGGEIGSWRDMMGAAVVVRSMLGVSPSAYQEACEAMGPENAAVAIACILERAGHINSAGGYLRDLTRRTARGEFSLGPMLMALVNANGGSMAKTG